MNPITKNRSVNSVNKYLAFPDHDPNIRSDSSTNPNENSRIDRISDNLRVFNMFLITAARDF